jgi:hypothetical protein
LLLRDPQGWSLPAVEHPDDWFAEEACNVARELGQRLKAPLTALRELETDGLRGCALENRDPGWRPPAGARWVDEAEARALPLTPPGQRMLLRAWFRQARRRWPPAGRAPWEQPGWFDEAVAWIHEQLDRIGLTPAGPVEQFKTAWSCSGILRVPTTTGMLYFKADYARPPAEGAVIAELARRWPRNVPRILAAEDTRRWILLEDFGDRSLTRLPFARWPGAMRLFARLQRAAAADLEPWIAMGCPDRRARALGETLDELKEDPVLMRADPPDRPRPEELRRLRKRRGRWAEELAALAASPVPVSFVQQDFRDGNIAVHGRTYIFYDWSDTVLTHPFFSACRFLEYVLTTRDCPRRVRRLATRERYARLRDAYLEPWTEYASIARLRQEFERTQRLNTLYQAVRWYRELPYSEVGSPWWRGILGCTVEAVRALSLEGVSRG